MLPSHGHSILTCLFQADGGDQRWLMVMACLAETLLGAASSTSWDIFFCPSDHKSSLKSDSHGDIIFRGCLHPTTSLAWALAPRIFLHWSWMSHILGYEPNSCIAAFTEVMRPQHCLCSPMGNTEHLRGTHEPGEEVKGEPNSY